MQPVGVPAEQINPISITGKSRRSLAAFVQQSNFALVAIAAVVAVLGFILAGMSDRTVSVLGSIIVAAATFMISWIVSGNDARDIQLQEEAQRVRATFEHVDSVCHHLAVAASQIHAICTDQVSGPEVSLEKVLQCTSQLEACIDTIQTITKGTVDVDRFKMRRLQIQSMIADTENSYEFLQNDPQWDEIKSALLNMSSTTTLKPMEQVKVICPYCEYKFDSSVRAGAGESASPNCPNCGEKFHVNRGAEAQLSFRRFGQKATVVVAEESPLRLQCPNCGDGNVIISKWNPTGWEERYCFACGAKLIVSKSTRSITNTVAKDKVKVKEVSWDGAVMILHCPLCNGDHRTFYSDKGFAYATCRLHQTLLFSDVAEDSGSTDSGNLLLSAPNLAGVSSTELVKLPIPNVEVETQRS